MSRKLLWRLAKVLQAVGLVVVLWGLLWSVQLGFEDRGLESMALEFQGLGIGGALFLVGWLIERSGAGR